MDNPTAPHPEIRRPNRREFLYYLGGAGVLLLTGGLGVGLSKYLNPPPRYGERSGIYKISLKDIPAVNAQPNNFPEGRYWLVNTEQGLIALDGWCSFLHTRLVHWVDINNRFECPQCGAKFRIDGTWIEGPATRGLDRFMIEITMDKETMTTPTDGSPISIVGAQQVVINTIGRIPGKPRLPEKDEFTPPLGTS